jgi:hypothetical protein
MSCVSLYAYDIAWEIGTDAVFLTDLPARDACCDHLREDVEVWGKPIRLEPSFEGWLLAPVVACDIRGETIGLERGLK